jgi:hypothetical protein
MAKKNHYSNGFKSKLTRADWEALCPPMEYRVIDGPQAYALGIVPTGMSQVNCVVVGASGSTADTMMYFANYKRVDLPDLDQEPYFELYERGASQSDLYGNFHHALFPGRTMPLDASALARIAASGSTADISFLSKPSKDAGTLDELQAEGKIAGFDYTWSMGMGLKGANSSNSGSTPHAGAEEKK